MQVATAAKNGYYGSLVPMVRDAFLVSELVRIDCQGLERSDYKKIGCKLRVNLNFCLHSLLKLFPYFFLFLFFFGGGGGNQPLNPLEDFLVSRSLV